MRRIINKGKTVRIIEHSYVASDSTPDDLELAKQNLAKAGIFI